jgi:4-hydroxybutyrate CoA-transferase
MHSIDRRRAAESLLAGRRSARVLAAMSPQLPTELVAELVRVARVRNIELTLLVADLSGAWEFVDSTAVEDVAAGRLHLVGLAGGVPRRLSRLVDYLPNSLWEIDRLIATGELAVDIFVARVGAGVVPCEVTYGELIGYSESAMATAARVGFEVVLDTVRFDGAGGVRLDRADVVVVGTPNHDEPGAPAYSMETKGIARSVAGLVPDGATVQIGLGAVPLAVIPELIGKADLGVHSGILPAALQGLLRSGVLTGAGKEVDCGRVVATGVLGGAAGEWGPEVLLRPISYTHDPVRLLAFESLWAINSAFEVDLAGQVNAEFAGEHRVASGGGQVDFVRAAHASRQGAAVIVLPSRTRSGHPRIVPALRPGCPATTPGSDVDYVVTEYGVARLRGRTAAERRTELIAVAHPEDRAGLVQLGDSAAAVR